MERALPARHRDSHGLLSLIGDVQETTLAHDVCEKHEPALIGTEYFTYQDETQ